MEKPKKLTDFDFPRTVGIPDGYDTKYIPDASTENFCVLVEEHNKLVDVVDMLCDRCGFVFEKSTNE